MTKPLYENGQLLTYESRLGIVVKYNEKTGEYLTFWPWYVGTTEANGLFSHYEFQITVWVNRYEKFAKKLKK